MNLHSLHSYELINKRFLFYKALNEAAMFLPGERLSSYNKLRSQQILQFKHQCIFFYWVFGDCKVSSRVAESRNYSEQKLKCPRHLPEKDFLELLRSMFPQLRADKPLELLKYNRKKNLRPLKLKSLTPLEIIKNVSIHSALYIRLRVWRCKMIKRLKI